MKNALRSLLLLGCLLPAQADVYIYNTINERLTYQITLPNGDTKDGVIEPSKTGEPEQTTLRTPRDKVVTFKIVSESGGTGMEVKAPDMRNYLLGMKDGKLLWKAVSWNTEYGQTHKREMTFYNATGSPQSFSLVDEKEIRQFSVGPGEEITVAAKNGFHAGNHHLKFPDGTRQDNAVSTGHYCVLYLDSKGKVEADDYGWLTPPKNAILK